MPVQTCQKGGKSGHKWGPNGVCFTSSDSRARAAAVGRAIFAQGTEKRMDRTERLSALKSIASQKPIDKDAHLVDIMEIGVVALALHNVLHNRSSHDDGPDFEMDELFDTVKQLTNESTGADDEADIYKSVPLTVIKSIDEERQLVTALVLRPDEPDLHGDIYTALEVEKACHNFNVVCRKTNTQHKNASNAEVVESYVSPADFELGEGIVKSGDWIMTMHVVDPSEWEAVQKGEFTGFSIGCVAEVEEL